MRIHSNEEARNPSCSTSRSKSYIARAGQLKTWPMSQGKMNKGIDTFTQLDGTLSRRAEEAPIKLTSRGYRRIPLETVDENSPGNFNGGQWGRVLVFKTPKNCRFPVNCICTHATGSRPPEHETCAHDVAAACGRMPR